MLELVVRTEDSVVYLFFLFKTQSLLLLLQLNFALFL